MSRPSRTLHCRCDAIYGPPFEEVPPSASKKTPLEAQSANLTAQSVAHKPVETVIYPPKTIKENP